MSKWRRKGSVISRRAMHEPTLSGQQGSQRDRLFHFMAPHRLAGDDPLATAVEGGVHRAWP